MRQSPGTFGGAYANTGILFAAMVTCKVTVKPAPCRQHARQTAAIQTLAMQLGNKAPDVGNVQRGGYCAARHGQQRFYVAPVILGRVRREPALMGQVFQITLQLRLHGIGC